MEFKRVLFLKKQMVQKMGKQAAPITEQDAFSMDALTLAYRRCRLVPLHPGYTHSYRYLPGADPFDTDFGNCIGTLAEPYPF